MMSADHDKPKAGGLATLLGLADGFLTDLPVEHREALSAKAGTAVRLNEHDEFGRAATPRFLRRHLSSICGPRFIRHFDEEVSAPES